VEEVEAVAEVVVAEEEEIDPATIVSRQVILHVNALRNRPVTVEASEVAAEEEEEIDPATNVDSPVILHVNVQMKNRRVAVEVSEVVEVEEEEEALATTVIRQDILQENALTVAKEKSALVTSVDSLDILQEIALMVAKVNHEEEEEWTISLVTIVVVLATFQEIVHLQKHLAVAVANAAKIATAVDQLTIWPEIVQTKVMTK